MSNDHNHHGYYTGDIHNQFVEEHYNPKNKAIIWRTFWILLAITLFEVGIVFFHLPHLLMITIFVTLTIVKAYFIVKIFMHLGDEKKSFQGSIVLPFLLILYLIVMVLIEGNYLHLSDSLFK